ncbi:Ras family protein [Histomonas meleagridis]|uniref:Ras family protein n=1 Tax=Histomonas meleagridis TaxID=135588 RepID=UPI00355A0448|nr:Ras family protein [Histomonas meleagridis]KAH0803600.1 Ras family protein [Histomonas meleagridis]
MTKQPQHKIVFIGNSAVGKTSIINQYTFGSSSEDHQPTVGIDFFAKQINVDGKQIRLQIWDTAGQEKFKSLIPSYVRTSTVAVYVFDITSRESFEELEKWHKMVIELANPSVIVVGNKTDLAESRTVSTEEAKKYAESLGAQYIETSARTPSNIQELFLLAARQKIPEAEPSPTGEGPNQPQTVEIKKDQQSAPSGGCGC